MTEQTIPSTPQDVAAAVLDAIKAQPGHFDMSTWASLGWGEELAPGANLCGTTMCAAGWAAHLTGWKLINGREPVAVGGDNKACFYAERNGERRFIEDVAAESLGLPSDTGLWWESEEYALERLREIAGR